MTETSMQEAFDLIINGNGIFGLSLACGLYASGLRIAIITSKKSEEVSQLSQKDLKIFIINNASKLLLQHLHIWESFSAKQINSFRKVIISEQDGFGRVHFDYSKSIDQDFGYIIEYTLLQKVLLERVEKLENVQLIISNPLHQVSWEKDKVFIKLNDNRKLQAKLIIAADDMCSWIRTSAGIPMIFRNYQHHTMTAIVHTELPHKGIIRQIFYDDGILTFLPLKDSYLSFIIWSLPAIMAYKYLEKSINIFNVLLSRRADLILGLCKLQEDKRQVFLFTGCYARNFATHRLILLGDAAHTIYSPVGHNVNIGFMDVAMALEKLHCLQNEGKDIGHYPYWQFHSYNRKCNAILMLKEMQWFYELFIHQHPTKRCLRHIGLWLGNNFPEIKLHFIRKIMGFQKPSPWLVKGKIF
ncbi:FAD-dependent monooxygenase [Sodalis sp. CWE]|uniref:FAD-dependent monooxygenase n=1 Tax=Sodalis sp. CWE TaxID=2803816 RepID=UPI001C7D3ABC|nr:FAD-dependent monooxygenase [Sodalis sp. CWE]MBX4180891.1 FAD-dependent monooxygenase [Sodalis sp. CWE]